MHKCGSSLLSLFLSSAFFSFFALFCLSSTFLIHCGHWTCQGCCYLHCFNQECYCHLRWMLCWYVKFWRIWMWWSFVFIHHGILIFDNQHLFKCSQECSFWIIILFVVAGLVCVEFCKSPEDACYQLALTDLLHRQW